MSSDVSIAPERKQPMLDHMNEDHADANLRYARHFGGVMAATKAILRDISLVGMDLDATVAGTTQTVHIAFEPPLANPDEAHMRLVKMAKAARRAMGE